ncbi:hypothetical protein PGTUg99_021528 [Puccinia graminis f. sp. tritici]|nr:hypothetical protein PGTUg99_021528 [Puccinia graminis f. sp. tritici]
MAGKTRLLMEMSQHICVIFICLGPSDSNGYPPRSALADYMLAPNLINSDTHYTIPVAAIFRAVVKFFNRQDGRMNKEERLKEWNDYIEVAS